MKHLDLEFALPGLSHPHEKWEECRKRSDLRVVMFSKQPHMRMQCRIKMLLPAAPNSASNNWIALDEAGDE